MMNIVTCIQLHLIILGWLKAKFLFFTEVSQKCPGFQIMQYVPCDQLSEVNCVHALPPEGEYQFQFQTNFQFLIICLFVCPYFCPTFIQSATFIFIETDAAPIANAGPDVYLTPPTNVAILNGSLSSDNKGIQYYKWTKSSYHAQTVDMVVRNIFAW